MNKRLLRLALIGLLMFSSIRGAFADEPPRYIAFQFFTAIGDSTLLRRIFPPMLKDLAGVVSELRDRIGVTGTGNRRIGFILGPIALDNSDEDVRELVGSGFDIALRTGVSVGFHIDDSMFWGRLRELNKPEAIEWLDWNGTLNTGRRLNWDPPNAVKIKPQLCLNSPAVKDAVRARAALIGKEIAKGIQKLDAANKGDLYLGVIAGWETQIGLDFDTGKPLGYCALTNAGYSAKNPPADSDEALTKIVLDFIELWAQTLTEAGAPAGKVFSHLALTTPKSLSAAFCKSCVPGVSIYPFPGLLEAWRDELAKHGNPPWASPEGSPMDPREARGSGYGLGMEGYLGNLFNHGAVLVNVFGWGLGDPNNPFRRNAENPEALEAYRMFLRGEKLREAGVPDLMSTLPASLRDRVRKVQAALPGWLQKNDPAPLKENIHNLNRAVEDQRYDDAEKSADAILKTIGQ